MSTPTETSDTLLLDLLRARGSMNVAEMARASRVTATAVRQRLTRLMGQGLVERGAAPAGRGRPSHRYSLTERARRQAGSNFADLALVLWDEIRAVKDPDIRRGLLQRLAGSLARMYRDRVAGATVHDRLQSLEQLLADRRVPAAVDGNAGDPRLTVVECPYPDLAERDRGVCAMEKLLFAELLEAPVRLSQCRLEGHSCCQFEVTGSSPVTFEPGECGI